MKITTEQEKALAEIELSEIEQAPAMLEVLEEISKMPCLAELLGEPSDCGCASCLAKAVLAKIKATSPTQAIPTPIDAATSEDAEDVTDIMGIVMPYEAPLLDYLYKNELHSGTGISVSKAVQATPEVLGATLKLDDEIDYQKQTILRECLRELEAEVVKQWPAGDRLEFNEDAMSIPMTIAVGGKTLREIKALPATVEISGPSKALSDTLMTKWGEVKYILCRYVPEGQILNVAYGTHVQPVKPFAYTRKHRGDNTESGIIAGEYALVSDVMQTQGESNGN